jgi:HD-like signal output (HDOD) protein
MSTATVPASTSDQVDALVKSIRIPPRPSLLADLQRELAAPTPSLHAIARIVASDVGMSGALLKLANSPLYGGRRKAASIEQAILFLGISQVASLMTGLLAREAIPATSPALAGFWDLSNRRAQSMVFLARRVRIGAPDIVHTFGLFCDTGVPLLMERFADYSATFARAAADPLRPLTALELEQHDTSHAAIGSLLARNWGLSADVAWAILHHHDYAVLDDAATSDAVRSLVALSLLAERALARYQGHAESLEWNKGGARAGAYLGLQEEEMLELLDELNDAFHEQD